MFDQNWLKRYMLSSQGAAAATELNKVPERSIPETPTKVSFRGAAGGLSQRTPSLAGEPLPLQGEPVPDLPRALSGAPPSELLLQPGGQFPRAASVAPSDAGPQPFAEPPLSRVEPGLQPALGATGLRPPLLRPPVAYSEASGGSARAGGGQLFERSSPSCPAPSTPAMPPWPALVTPGAYGQLGLPAPWASGQEGQMKHYVVMCKDDVEVRASPTYSDDTRVGHFLHPGQVVAVDDRRNMQGAWFLHLADGRGWVFETKDRLLVTTEAHGFERGLWHYSVVCEDDVETRMTPTYSDDARTGLVLGSGDCVAVDERCSIAGARFLKLADGRGWVFETKDRLVVMSEVRAHIQEPRDFARGLWHYTVVCDDDVEIRAGPTYSDEARTGLMLHPGDCIPVDERCRVGAAWFLRLADNRGWVFETKDSRHVMAQLR